MWVIHANLGFLYGKRCQHTEMQFSLYNKQTVDMIKHETEAQKSHHNPFTELQHAPVLWPLQLSLIQKNTTLLEAAWTSHTAALAAVPPPPSPGRCGWGEDLSHYAWCSLPLSASCATLPADLQRNKKVRCSPTPTRISFRSGGGKNHVTRKLSWPWYNWNSFRWCKILQKGGVNTPVNEAGYSEPWQT